MFTTLISCEELHGRLSDPDLRIIDCRYDLMDKTAGRLAYQTGHIPAAIYLDVHDDLSGPPITNRGRHPLPTEAEMNRLFSRAGIGQDTQVVVYDDSFGAFAARMWWMCQHMRHQSVAVLDGGWQAWLDQKLPTSSQADRQAESVSATQFQSQALADQVVNIDDVSDYELIIDSREPPRYRGEIEPIDPVAGHIPGAINRFWKDNLQENGQFKPKAELNQGFSELLSNNSVEQTVVYCGSGVTACHNILAMCHAGLGVAKLYAGSWSEWSNTPDKPVATETDS